MSIPSWLRRLGLLPIYPLLASAYPIVWLYAQNVQEAIALSEVLVPLAISVAATTVALLIIGGLTHRWAGSALTTTLLLVLFFTYGMAWTWLGPMLAGQWVLLGLWLLLAAIGLALIWRFHRLAARLTLPLNVAIGIALALNLVTIGAFILNVRPAVAHTGSGVTATGDPASVEKRPDIYWIITEEYGSQSVMKSDFGYDNSPFIDALQDRGFYVAAHSTANYLKTAPSIESARNLTYLDGEALRDEAKSDSDWGPIYKALQSPFEVQEFLGNLDYRFIYAGTFWAPMGRHPSAEINYVYDQTASEFLDVLKAATLPRALDDLVPDAPSDWRLNRYDQTLYQLRSLRHASTLAGPKFIQTQLALNHEPYVFHPDGTFITADQAKSMTHAQQFVEQLKYTNVQLLAWVDQLLAVPADQRPIIVLMADEGPWNPGYRQDELGFDWTTASDADLKEKFGILNAVYLPGKSAEKVGFYDSISEVNEFRVIFNAYFGLKLPLLPDRNYIWPNQSDLYSFIDVTDKVAR
jgi:hypothetical protein